MFKPLLTTQTREIKWEMERMKQNIIAQDERLDILEEQMKDILHNQSAGTRSELNLERNDNKDPLTNDKPEIPTRVDLNEKISKTIETKLEKLRQDQEQNTLRLRSIIIHGAQEIEEKNLQKRILNEREEITSIIKDLGVTTTVMRHSRLGKFNNSADKPRLLRVTVENEIHRNDILKKANNQTKVMITPDRSKQDRDTRKKLVTELKERKEKGEKNLAIRNNQIVSIPERDSVHKQTLNAPFRI